MIDDFFDVFAGLPEYDGLPGLCRVMLLPSRQAELDRLRQRGGETEYLAGAIDLHLAGLPPVAELEQAGWFVVDNSTMSPEQTRDILIEHAARWFSR